MQSRLWVVLALLVVLFSPMDAHASELSDSFVNGLNIWNEEPKVVSNERNTLKTEGAETVTETENDAVTVVNGVVPVFYRVPLDVGNRSPIEFIRFLFRGRSGETWGPVPIAVTLVFLWWGVRKAIRMLFAAFRKGRINA